MREEIISEKDKCPHCKGKGEIEFEYNLGRSKISCSSCHGTGNRKNNRAIKKFYDFNVDKKDGDQN